MGRYEGAASGGDSMENQTLEHFSLFRGPPACEPRAPWSPVSALLAAVIIVAASILGAVLVLGVGNVASTSAGGSSPRMWRQERAHWPRSPSGKAIA